MAEQSPLLSDDVQSGLEGSINDDAVQVRSRQMRPYLAAVVILMSTFLNYVCIFLPAAFYPQRAEKKKGSEAGTEVGLVIGSISLSALVGSALVGMHVNRVGAKFLIISGAFLVGGCTVIFGFLDMIADWRSFFGLSVAIRLIAGFGEAAFDTTTTALMLTMFPSHTATAWSLVELAVGLGFIAGAPIGGALFDIGGFLLPFVVTGGMVLLFIPLLLFVLPGIQSHLQHQESETQLSMWQLTKKLPVVMVCLSVFLANAPLGLLDTSLALYLDHTFGWSATHIGLLLLLLGAVYVVSAPVVGLVVDATKPRLVMILGLLTEGCAMMLIGPVSVFSFLSPHPWLDYLGMVLIGFGFSMTMISAAPVIINYATSRGYERGMSLNGLVSGIVLSVTFMGNIGGALLGGVLTDSYHFRITTTVYAIALFVQVMLFVTVTVVDRCQADTGA